MRDNSWLAERLQTIHRSYFADVPIRNTLYVRFGRNSRTRLGSIIAKPHPAHTLPVTYISINALFRSEDVPEYVIEATLAHEMAHYTHGFHSPLERKYQHPHRGDVVNKELRNRGAGHLLTQQERWLKEEYRDLLRRNHML